MNVTFPARAAACLVLLPALLLACTGAQAGRPMVVDDATIVDRDQCQLEAWTQHPPGLTEYWAMPACRAGAWELGAGLGRIAPDSPGTPAYFSHVLHAKTIFRPLTTNGWGIGLTITDQYRGAGNLSGDLSALVPFTVSLLDDRVLVHANVGWQRQRSVHSNNALWALGAEWAAKGPLTLTLEAYGNQRAPSFTQAGMRLDVIRNRLALDAGVGQRLARGGTLRYFTIGLTLVGAVLR